MVLWDNFRHSHTADTYDPCQCIYRSKYHCIKLQSETLLIAFGLIKKQILYEDITALLITNNPTSSLAASLDRIEIKCGGKSEVMIALVDKKI